jgi:hypothetical protein
VNAKPACPRLFEVEALRDGRLSGAEVQHFQSHLDVCAICARETRALDALAEALRFSANSSATRPDELRVRRERTRLLAAFDAKLVPSPRTTVRVGLLATAAAVAVIAVLVLVFWRSPAFLPAPAIAVAPNAPATVPTEPVIVRTDAGAKWSRRAEKQLETIMLESGALSIHVTHVGSSRRLLVVLPDGELEDIGTTFSVSVDAGRTTSVTVTEGSVVLRLRGKPSVALAVGESWRVTPDTTASAAPSPSQLPSKRRAPAPAASAAKLEPRPDSSNEFRAATAELNAGNNAHAAALFADFLARYPHDPRSEDAAYLRVIGLQRARDPSAAQQAAAEYLRRYPHGFRKAEVERLAR